MDLRRERRRAWIGNKEKKSERGRACTDKEKVEGRSAWIGKDKGKREIERLSKKV